MRREDAALAARDRALPGLALVLDDAAFTALLRERLPAASVRSARGRYVRYKAGTSCLVAFEVRLAGGPAQHLYARAATAAGREKLRKLASRATVADGPLGTGALLALDDSLAVVALPNDRRLPDLPALFADARPVEILAYKPERRLVARRGGTVVKAYARDGFDRARAAAAALATAEGVPVQRLLRASRRRAALTFEWAEGRPLDALLEAGEAEGEAAAVARVLSALHACAPSAPLPARQAPDLVAAARATAVAGEAVAAVAERLAERLARQAPPAGAPRLVHGDFSVDQVVCGPGGPVLLDLDAAGLGDPAEDLGSLVADLELRMVEGRLERGRADAFAEAMAAAYPAPPAAVRHHAAAGLLRRAAEPFRRRRPGWDAEVAAAVERAAALAPAGSRARRRGGGSVLGALERLPLPEGEAVLRRAWPRPGGRLLLEYRGPEGITGAQWTAGPGRFDVPAGAVVLATAGGARVLVHRGGADARLPALRGLLARPEARLLAHRPTRRAAVALGGVAFVKVVPPGRADAVAGAMTAAGRLAGGAFRVPELLGVEGGAVACAPLRGRPLSDLLDGPDGIAAVTGLGAAVRALHEARVPAGAAVHDAASEAALVRRFAAGIVPYAPELARAAGIAADGVARQLAALGPAPSGPLHRDLHDKQVLVDAGGALGLIDFDTLAAGDPALDAGNLLAHLELRTLQGRCTAAAAAALRGAFLDGYGPVDERHLAAYVAATRVRLACVYALRPSWRSLGAALLAATSLSRSRALMRATSSANENGLVR